MRLVIQFEGGLYRYVPHAPEEFMGAHTFFTLVPGLEDQLLGVYVSFMGKMARGVPIYEESAMGSRMAQDAPQLTNVPDPNTVTP